MTQPRLEALRADLRNLQVGPLSRLRTERNPEFTIIKGKQQMKVVKTDDNRPMTLTEIEIYHQFEQSDQPGQVLWWPLVADDDPAPDCLVSLEEICRFPAVFLRGTWSVANGQWYHRDEDDVDVPVVNPLEAAWKCAMSVKNRLEQKDDFGCYVIPVVVFTDMEESRHIMQEFGNRKVRPLWGRDNLLAKFADLPTSRQIQKKLSSWYISQDMRTLTCPPAENAAAPSEVAVDVGEVAIDLRGETGHINITIDACRGKKGGDASSHGENR